MFKNQKDKYFCFFLAITAFICGIWVIAIPSEGQGIFFGMTAARLSIVAVLFLIGFFLFGLLLNPKNIFQPLGQFTKAHPELFQAVFSSFAFLGLFFGATALITYILFQQYAWARVLQRLLPVTTFFLVAGLAYPVFGFKQFKYKIKDMHKHAWFVFAGIILIFSTILVGSLVWKMGLIYEPGGWMSGLPVPVYPAQAGLMFMLGLFLSWLFSQAKSLKISKSQWIDIAVGIGIWAAAYWIWSGYKLPNTYYLPRPMPPTMQFFPFSDARGYDRAAYSILTGEMGLNQRIPDHPFLPFLLSLFHMFAGDKYSAVIQVQTVVLACFPAALFFLGKRMSGRLAGIFAAGFMIMREANTLSVASLVLTSNSKLYMTEFPAMLLLCLACVILVEQLTPKNKKSNWKWLALGAILGLAILLRVQTIVLFAVSLGAVAFIFFKKPGFTKAILSIILGCFLLLIPWIVRNYFLTGTIVIDSPRAMSQATALVGLQTTEAESRNVSVDPSSAVGTSLGYIMRNPGPFLFTTLNHFAHSEIVSLYTFPVLSQPVEGIDTILTPPLFYWSAQNDPAPIKDFLALMAAVVIIGVGVAAGFQKVGWAATVPLLFHFAYNLSSAFVRFSGWRFGLPVDWVLLFYFAVDLAWIAERVIWLYSPKTKDLSIENTMVNAWNIVESKKSIEFISAAILSVGMVFVLASYIPVRYPKTDTSYVAEEITQIQSLSSSEIQQILSNQEQVIYKGLSLYPRYYQAGKGEPSSDVFYKARDYARLLFVYMGSDNFDVEFAFDVIPEKINHAHEVYFGGQFRGKEFYADWLLINEENPILYIGGKK